MGCDERPPTQHTLICWLGCIRQMCSSPSLAGSPPCDRTFFFLLSRYPWARGFLTEGLCLGEGGWGCVAGSGGGSRRGPGGGLAGWHASLKWSRGYAMHARAANMCEGAALDTLIWPGEGGEGGEGLARAYHKLGRLPLIGVLPSTMVAAIYD